MLPIFLLLFTMFLCPLCVLFYLTISFLCPQITGHVLVHPFQSDCVLASVSPNFIYSVPLCVPQTNWHPLIFIQTLAYFCSSFLLRACLDVEITYFVTMFHTTLRNVIDIVYLSPAVHSFNLYTPCILFSLVMSFECPQIFSHVLVFPSGRAVCTSQFQ